MFVEFRNWHQKRIVFESAWSRLALIRAQLCRMRRGGGIYWHTFLSGTGSLCLVLWGTIAPNRLAPSLIGGRGRGLLKSHLREALTIPFFSRKSGRTENKGVLNEPD